jgi:hypothetical protein
LAQYIVFTESGRCKGYIPSKEIYKDFKQQRNVSAYNIVKVKDKDVKHIKVQDIHEIGSFNDVLMFLDEEEYFYESFSQLLIDFECIIKRIIKDVLPVLKLTEEEYHKVYTFLKWCYERIRCLDDDVDPELIFNMSAMARFIINELGG